MYQKVVIVGNLGRDPELRYTATGTPVANFPVATNRRWNDTDGNTNEETTWFRVSVFGRQAEICNQYLEKGRVVLCEGEIRTSQYEQEGQTRYSWELRANTVKFLGGGSGERSPMQDFADAPHDAAPMGGSGASGGSGSSGGRRAAAPQVSEDDIPF